MPYSHNLSMYFSSPSITRWGDMKSPSGRGVEMSGIFKWAGVVVLISRGACLTSLPRTWLSTRQPPEKNLAVPVTGSR